MSNKRPLPISKHSWIPCPLCGISFDVRTWRWEDGHSIPTGTPGESRGVCQPCGEKRTAEARALIEAIKTEPEVVALHQQFLEQEPDTFAWYNYDVEDIGVWLFEQWKSHHITEEGGTVCLNVPKYTPQGFILLSARLAAAGDLEWPDTL